MSFQAYNSATDTLTPIAENDYKDSLEKVSALPTASADLLNMCYLLTANQGTYTKGNIYQCQSNGSDGYAWILINSSGGSNAVDVVEDGNMNAVTSNAVYNKFETLGTASAKDVTNFVSPTDSGVPISSSVFSAITNALYGAYHPSGSKTIAELDSSLLIQANVGNVYKITDSGVTTNLFIGGAGQTINVGDNAVVVYDTSGETFKYDLQTGVVDLSKYQTKELETPLTIDGQQETTVEGALDALNRQVLYADNPLGTILPYGGTIVPTGWLLCDGSAVSRTTYADLFGIIGTSFGSGNGSTTFNLPDMRESVPKGAGLTGHTVGNHLDEDGLQLGEFLDDRVQAHTHLMGVTQSSLANGDTYSKAVINVATVPLTTMENSGRKGDTTEVKSVGVNYIIKAKMVGVPSDFLAKVDEAVEDAMGHSKVTIPFSSFVNPESHINSQYSTMTWHKFSNFGVLQFAILIDGGVAVDTRCMITENVKSLLGITNAWGREEVGIGGITSNDNISIIGAQATVELRTGNDDDLRFRINSSNGGWIRGQLFLSKS